jgi:ubiquinone/menaquinone biosynthesis C-methylase UbiE
MLTNMDYGPGLHAPSGQPVNIAAYDGYLGRWSRLFAPAVLNIAEVSRGDRVLDLATGPGEAALMALSIVEQSGLVVGVDISEPMLEAARARLGNRSFRPVAADGHALPFRDGQFDAVVCQLSLQFFRDPAQGLGECCRVLRKGGRVAACVISTPDQAPMWGILADSLSRYFPQQEEMLYLSFALADVHQLERLLGTAGFRDVVVMRETRHGTIESFDAYWANVEAGVGMMPQAYRALPEASRRSVRDEVQARLSKYESGGRLAMSVEMVIGTGRA